MAALTMIAFFILLGYLATLLVIYVLKRKPKSETPKEKTDEKTDSSSNSNLRFETKTKIRNTKGEDG